MAKERFRFLAEHEELACLQPKRSDGIQLEVQLALTLRFLAGGSYLDLEKIFGVDGDTLLFTRSWGGKYLQRNPCISYHLLFALGARNALPISKVIPTLALSSNQMITPFNFYQSSMRIHVVFIIFINVA